MDCTKSKDMIQVVVAEIGEPQDHPLRGDVMRSRLAVTAVIMFAMLKHGAEFEPASSIAA